MTPEEFDNTDFFLNTVVIYNGQEYDIVGVDFDERLITIKGEYDDREVESTKRCESIKIK